MRVFLGMELDDTGGTTTANDESDSTGRKGQVSTPPATKEKKKLLFKKVVVSKENMQIYSFLICSKKMFNHTTWFHQ